MAMNPYSYLLPDLQRKQQLQAPPTAPSYYPSLPAPREVASAPTSQRLLPAHTAWSLELGAWNELASPRSRLPAPRSPLPAQRQQFQMPGPAPSYTPGLPMPHENAYGSTSHPLLPAQSLPSATTGGLPLATPVGPQFQTQGAAPSYTPGVPAPHENAATITSQNGYHPSLFPGVGTYSTGSGEPVPSPSQKRQQKSSLFAGADTYTGAPVPAPNSSLPPQPARDKPQIEGFSPIEGAVPETNLTQGLRFGRNKPQIEGFSPAFQDLSQALRFGRNPPQIEGYSPIGGAAGPVLPPGPVLPAGVTETRDVYGLSGINRYDDKSGVPTFTNKGVGGYNELQQGGGGASFLPGTGVADLIAGTGGRTALSSARQEAAARGDSDAIARSYRTPEEQQAFDYQKAISGITKSVRDTVQTRGLPAKALGEVLTGLKAAHGTLPDAKAGVYAAQTQKALAEARKAEAEAQRGDPRADFYGAKTEGARLDNQTKQQLQVLHQQYINEKDPERRKQIGDMILAIHGKTSALPHQGQGRIISQPELDKDGLPTGKKTYYRVDADNTLTPLGLPGPEIEAPQQAGSRTPDEVRAAYKAGKISREQARAAITQLLNP